MRCLLCAALCAIIACGEGSQVGSDPAPTRDSGPPVTYYADVRPLLDAYCVRCHKEGGSAPFALETESSVVTYCNQVVEAVESEFMPLVDDCPDFAGEFTLDATQRAVFSAWRDNEFELGQRADFVPLAKRCRSAPDSP